MSTSTTFPNGLALTSSALTVKQMDAIIQALICACLGLTMDEPIMGTLTAESDQVTAATGGVEGWEITGAGIPAGTTILEVDGSTLTLSQPATAGGSLIAFLITDPLCNTAVRTSWATEGQPAWGIADNVVFLTCFEEPDDYDLVRNEDWGADGDDDTISKTEEYTRVWSVSLEFRGPASFDNARLVRSALSQDFAHDTLAVSNLYLRPDVGAPRRAPELEAGQWWERTNLELHLNEDVQELMSIPTVASVELSAATNVSSVSISVVLDPEGFGDGGFGDGIFRG